MTARLGSAFLLAFFALFLAWPLAHVVDGAFRGPDGPTLQAFAQLFGNEVLLRSLGNSLWVAGATTLACTLLAFPLAQLFVTREFRGKAVLQALLLAALVLPPFVAAIGVRQLFARFGSVNLLLLQAGLVDAPIDFLGGHPLAGVIVMEVLHLYPILFLNLAAALANVDPSLHEAAESAGAGPWTRWRRVTLPLVLPGWFAGASVVFIFALTDIGSPLVFDVHALAAVQVYDRALEGSRDPVGYALVVLLLALCAGLFALGRRVTARDAASQGVKGTALARSRPLGPAGRWLALPALGLLALLTLLPHLSIALVAFSGRWFFSVLPQELTTRHVGEVLAHGIAYTGVRNSLAYASLSTAIDLVLGLGIAWLAVRRGGRLARGLDLLATLPLAVPGVVLAFGYSLCFTGTPLERLFDPRHGALLILVVGYSVRRLPYVVRAADAGLRQVPVALEEAARNLGAGGVTVLRRVTLPLLAGNLVAGGLLAFSFAMLEVSESLVLAPRTEDYPIAKAIYLLLGDIADGPQVACAMGLLGTALLTYSLLVAGRLLGRSLGELFRA